MQTDQNKSLNRTVLSTLWVALATVVITGCSSGVKLDDVKNSNYRDGTDPKNVAQVDVTNKGANALTDPNSPLAKRSVYFDFDSYSVKPEFQGLIDNHSKYLAANKSQKILIQGNTDERGTTEYNLALGQKRAEAVRQSLMLLGVQDKQMEAVSLGKEKPKAEGHDEAAWAQNRRADIVY